jgi:hypothetical protein
MSTLHPALFGVHLEMLPVSHYILLYEISAADGTPQDTDLFAVTAKFSEAAGLHDPLKKIYVTSRKAENLSIAMFASTLMNVRASISMMHSAVIPERCLCLSSPKIAIVCLNPHHPW